MDSAHGRRARAIRAHYARALGLGWRRSGDERCGISHPRWTKPSTLHPLDISNPLPKQDEGTFEIESQGWGHGVGLSQVSMYAMTHIHGFQYPDVFDFFYENSAIERLW